MITVLSGGTGTPKLLQGLKEVIDSKDITIVVNTLENEYFQAIKYFENNFYPVSLNLTIMLTRLKRVCCKC